MGDHQVHNSYSNQISSTPLLPFLSRSPQLDPVVNAQLSASITKPFYQTFPAGATTAGLNTSKTTTLGSLLQGYPEYTGVTESLILGQGINFNAFLFRVDKRMSNGLKLDFNFIHSRQLGTTTQLNTGGPLWYGETSDFPDHASVTAIYLLPFGKGPSLANDSRLIRCVSEGGRIRLRKKTMGSHKRTYLLLRRHR
jgi:hypothetical protein